MKRSQSAPVAESEFQRSSDERIQRARRRLVQWFQKEGRDLPWRRTKDPYSIWISEVMLQQTTAAAVVPYYKKFLKTFPDLQSLAKARRAAVYELWTGLGYYKRADCLIKAAEEIAARKQFPSSYKKLLKLPGFGPYTARAVSSLAFEEPCGVTDGNVIRFLSRFYNLPVKHWTTEGKARLQSLADQWAGAPEEGLFDERRRNGQVRSKQLAGAKQDSGRGKSKSRPASNRFPPSLINQALMEIGALVCKKTSPACGSCPVREDCAGFAAGAQQALPLQKPKAKTELLHWKPLLIKQKNRFAFVQNRSLPFLKGRLVFPGLLSKISAPPPAFHFQHSITRYKIYVSVQSAEAEMTAKAAPPRTSGTAEPTKDCPAEETGKLTYLDKERVKRRNPSSLIQKILRFSEKAPPGTRAPLTQAPLTRTPLTQAPPSRTARTGQRAFPPPGVKKPAAGGRRVCKRTVCRSKAGRAFGI